MTIQTKTFRVFISSTFIDFQMERNALQKVVFPKIKNLCEVHGAKFQAIDLRWGINEEASIDQKSVSICLNEIERCQQLSPRPNFLSLLGERYGWRPPPSEITESEYNLMLPHLSDDDKNLFASFYRLDLNARIPLKNGSHTALYKLKPREGEYKTYSIWSPVERKLHDILLNAARKARLDESDVLKYYASVTHLEINEGILNIPEPQNHIHCFIRKIKKLPESLKHEEFIDNDESAKKELSKLKHQLNQVLNGNVHNYQVDLSNQEEARQYLEHFCKDVYNALEKVILAEIQELSKVSELEEENLIHSIFAKERSDIFVGREEVITQIKNYIEGNTNYPLFILGEPGAGKSALLAKLYTSYLKNDLKLHGLARFIGISSKSSNSKDLLINICQQIDTICKNEKQEFSGNYEQLIKFVYKKIYLKSDAEEKDVIAKAMNYPKIVIFLDALDQLPSTDLARDLRWLSSELPPNIKLLISIATDDQELVNLVNYKFSTPKLVVQPLTIEQGEQILEDLLRKVDRCLQIEQKKYLMKQFSYSKSPLYLRLAFEEAKLWKSYDELNSIVLKKNINEVILILFQRLAAIHGKELVERVISYLGLARYGLTEDELINILTFDTSYFDNYYLKTIYHELPEKRLPVIVWSRLYYDLKNYLSERGADNTKVISYFHRQFYEVIKKEYLNEGKKLGYHSTLGAFFDIQQNKYTSDSKVIPNYRKMSELIYHLRNGKRWGDVKKNLLDLSFIESKSRAEMIEDLIEDYTGVIESVDKNWTALSNIQEFLHFVKNQSHIFRKYPNLVIQQAINQPDDSLPYGIAKQRIQQNERDLCYFEWINKPQSYGGLIMTIDAHSGQALSCDFSPDGKKCLTGSSDKTVKLWDLETGKLIKTFEGHLGSINDCQFTLNGKLFISASDDKVIKLWDIQSGQTIRDFIGHEEKVFNCKFTKDNKKILSASYDGTLRMWDVESGKCINIFKGKATHHYACDISPDESKIISASRDESKKDYLILWDAKSGSELITYNGYSDIIKVCAFSSDGRLIVSGSQDKSIKVWDLLTNQIQHSFAHLSYVESCVFSPDNTKLLSASTDKTLKVWDLATATELKTLRGHSNYVNKGKISDDGNRIISVSHDGTLKLWNMNFEEPVRIYEGHTWAIYDCEFSPDKKTIASVAGDGMLKMWDSENGKNVYSIKAHEWTINSCNFSPDGTHILTGSNDKLLKLWDSKTGNLIRTHQHDNYVKLVRFSPDMKKYVSGSVDKTFKLWDFASGEQINKNWGSHKGSILGGCFSSDSKLLVTCGRNQEIKLWDTTDGTLYKTFIGHTGDVYSSYFSSDNTKVLSSSEDKSVLLWDVLSGKILKKYIGHEDRIWDCAFLPGEEYIISVSKDNTIRIWDIETCEEVEKFPILGEGTCISIKNNDTILVGDWSGNLYLLKLYIKKKIIEPRENYKVKSAEEPKSYIPQLLNIDAQIEVARKKTEMPFEENLKAAVSIYRKAYIDLKNLVANNAELNAKLIDLREEIGNFISKNMISGDLITPNEKTKYLKENIIEFRKMGDLATKELQRYAKTAEILADIYKKLGSYIKPKDVSHKLEAVNLFYETIEIYEKILQIKENINESDIYQIKTIIVNYLLELGSFINEYYVTFKAHLDTIQELKKILTKLSNYVKVEDLDTNQLEKFAQIVYEFVIELEPVAKSFNEIEYAGTLWKICVLSWRALLERGKKERGRLGRDLFYCAEWFIHHPEQYEPNLYAKEIFQMITESLGINDALIKEYPKDANILYPVSAKYNFILGKFVYNNLTYFKNGSELALEKLELSRSYFGKFEVKSEHLLPMYAEDLFLIGKIYKSHPDPTYNIKSSEFLADALKIYEKIPEKTEKIIQNVEEIKKLLG